MTRLAAYEHVRLGVRLFGHRVGWDTQAENKLLRQTEYARPIPLELRPYNDVELALPLGRVDADILRRFDSVLATAKPWGETPLNLSLVDAIEDLAAADDHSDQLIIVLTDGINNQHEPAPDAAKTVADVLATRGDKNIRIDILGFHDVNRSLAETEATFDRLAKETGGVYFKAKDSASFLQSVEASLRPSPYAVYDGVMQIAAARVGTTLQLKEIPEGITNYSVHVDDIQQVIPFQPGDAFRLAVNWQDNRIVAEEYLALDPHFEPLLNAADASPTGHQVGVHQPGFRGDSLLIPISVQSTRAEVAARPAEIWIKVTPRASNQDLVFDSYVYYDAFYQDQTPVPLVSVEAKQWPKSADEAVVNVLCKPVRTAESYSVALSSVANRAPPTGVGFPVPSVPDVTFQARTGESTDPAAFYAVKVIERHALGETSVDSLKVEMWPTPRRVQHQFDAENSIVLHTFYFDNDAATKKDSFRVKFTTRSALAENAWHTPQPVVRRVSRDLDLIRLDALNDDK